MSLRATTILVISTCLCSITTAQEASFFSREWTFDLGHVQLIEDPLTIGKNNEFTYSTCDNQKNNQQNCTITLEYFNADGFVFKDRCSVNLRAKTGNKIPGLLMRSYLGDKVLFSFVEPVEARVDVYYRLVDMSTCHSSENRIVVNTGSGYDLEDALHTDLALMPYVVQYADGSYDLFTSDLKVCNAARCRYHVNDTGVSVKPTPYLPTEYSVNRIKMYPTKVNQAYFAVVTNDTKLGSDRPNDSNEVRILYALPDGSVKELLHLEDKSRLYDIDGDQGFLSVCWTTEHLENDSAMNIHCKQFSAQEGEVFDETFGFPYISRTLRIKNIGYGKFIMITEECKDRNCSKGSRFYLKCLKPQGRHSRSLEIDGFDPMSVTNYHKVRNTEISVDEDGILCISVSVEKTSNVGSTVSWQLLRKCIPGKYLDKQFKRN